MKMTEEQIDLTLKNINLARYTAMQWFNKGYNFSYEELFSFTLLGLCKASNTFRQEHGVQFSTYAMVCMKNEIKMEYRKKTRHKEESGLSLDAELESDFVGDLTGLDVYCSNSHLEFEELDNWEMLRDIFAKLEVRQRKILYMRYFKNMNQYEISKALKISRSYVSRQEHKALEKLKELIKSGGYYEDSK